MLSFQARAQFYSLGSEAAGVKWNQLRTSNYRIIYPRGLDSLAKVYALELEKAALKVGNSAGFRPNENYNKPMPVILHAHTAYSNGMVTWTPKRIELMTMPDPYYPESIPWVTQLALHESRHVSQMQFMEAKPFKWLSYLSGQLAAGALCAVYCGADFFEGDAVVAETALSKAGRGRTADFLEYFQVSLDTGDYRNYWRWRFGSVRHYTPDYYRVGYITFAGIRALYDTPDFTARYFIRIKDHKGFAFNNFGKTVQEVSGKKFNYAFAEISDYLASFWQQDKVARAPFIPFEHVTSAGKRYTELNDLVFAGYTLYAIQSGITLPSSLVSISTEGKIKSHSVFNSSYTGLEYSPVTEYIYWSEYSFDPRWNLHSYSDIRYIGKYGEKRTLTRNKRYFHPAASTNEPLLSVSEYPLDGSSAVVILEAFTGNVIASIPAPEGMQVVETVWIGEEIYTSAITEEGYGIYKLPDFRCVLGTTSVKIKQLWAHEGKIMFTADLSGVNELYALDLSQDNSVFQLTSTRFGAADFRFSPKNPFDGSYELYYTLLYPEGRVIGKTHHKDLIYRKVYFTKLPEFPFVSALAEGEATLAAEEETLDEVVEVLVVEEEILPKEEDDETIAEIEETLDEAKEALDKVEALPEVKEDDTLVEVEKVLAEEDDTLSEDKALYELEYKIKSTEPKKYSRLSNLIRFHSWLPIFVDYDAVESLSFASLTTAAGLGATAFFQNDLGNAYGAVGYKVAYENGAKWWHSAHLNFAYTGWYPVIDLGLDFNERYTISYQDISTINGRGLQSSYLPNTSLLELDLDVYVPFTFYKGGYSSGIIPQLSLAATNDQFLDSVGSFLTYMSRATASLRGYIMESIPASRIYPRWGIGMQSGVVFRPMLTNLICPNAFSYLYGYIPGFWQTHGTRLTAIYERRIESGAYYEAYLTTTPRGFSSLGSSNLALYPSRLKLTADYAMPILPLDWGGLGRLAYVKNFELTLHGDLSLGFPENMTNYTMANLYSVGADFCVRLGNLAWIPYDTRIGISWSYKDGSLFQQLQNMGMENSHHSISMTLSVDM